MTTQLFTTAQPLFTTADHPFTPAPRTPDAGLICELPSDFAEAMRKAMDDALDAGNVHQYLRAKRSLRAHYRYHAMQHRDASPFPISHDDHLASVAHQSNYHAKGDVERMSVGLSEVSEWTPPLLRQMDAARGVERVTYDVEMPWGTQTTEDWLSIAQRDKIDPDRDRDELPSDFTLSSIALAERLGVHVDDLDHGMKARTTNTYSPAE